MLQPNKRKLKTTALLILLFLSTGCVKKAGKSDDPFAGWKHYENKNLAVSFRYPDNMEIVQFDNGQSALPITFEKKMLFTGKTHIDGGEAKVSYSVILPDPATTYSQGTVKIGNEDAYVSGYITGDKIYRYYNVYKNSFNYVISFESKDTQKSIELAKKMLASTGIALLPELPKADQAALDRDTLRYSSYRAIAVALEKYYKENKTYPKSLEELVPDYLKAEEIQAPEPLDGDCTKKQNQFSYKLNTSKNYILTLCVKGPISNLKPGLNKFNKNGIQN